MTSSARARIDANLSKLSVSQGVKGGNAEQPVSGLDSGSATGMKQPAGDQDEEMKLQIRGLIPPGQQFYRNVLFDKLYASIPKDAEAKVQIYTAEIAPKGWTNFHCHNGATFFLALQGIFEAHFEEGVLVRAKAGDVYSEPIGKMHRGHNPHATIPYLCVAICITAPDRDHVTSVLKAF
jgi:quercetin dioxygenase-like cupin family protein